LDANDLFRLNPSYKRKIINGSKSNPSRLIVPKVQTSEYAKLYNFLQEKPYPQEALAKNENKINTQSDSPIKPKPEKTYIAYKVRKGDTLDAITKRFKGSSVSSLKAMNGLKNNTIRVGMTLKIDQN